MDDDWRHLGLCTQEDPELFFPVGTGPEAIEQTRRAKAICDRCPVREPCLDYAIATRQQNGVWGGQSEEELRRLIRRQARARSAA
ncbi:MAG: WhiB family transcriptional regulator [Actinomycetes bacterium]